ncbi:MAG: rhodanese-like domain-containing protein [Roseiflexus sp.]|nr:rhodanese-like domain-containing protein [Roseiflexus sp.]MCS7288366.1 rhodanese-like domain-containing protein [Roseiflexus sp.]MDW8146516.1 rhodanese-like domain-containing protein [Roseiflexaceae bacterium]MDW8231205.1 rhodanese-like domain-containing protein [Roseiflexaceae bacterium]
MFNVFRLRPRPDEITPVEVQQRLARGERLYLLDVREREEYVEAHIPDSVLIPLGQLSRKLSSIPKDATIIAICRSGNRSGIAADILRRAGYSNVLNLRGGIIAWVRAGLPIVT